MKQGAGADAGPLAPVSRGLRSPVERVDQMSSFTSTNKLLQLPIHLPSQVKIIDLRMQAERRDAAEEFAACDLNWWTCLPDRGRILGFLYATLEETSARIVFLAVLRSTGGGGSVRLYAANSRPTSRVRWPS